MKNVEYDTSPYVGRLVLLYGDYPNPPKHTEPKFPSIDEAKELARKQFIKQLGHCYMDIPIASDPRRVEHARFCLRDFLREPNDMTGRNNNPRKMEIRVIEKRVFNLECREKELYELYEDLRAVLGAHGMIEADPKSLQPGRKVGR